ncbi:unnamed protein product, partial [Penicillium egyptiacum]
NAAPTVYSSTIFSTNTDAYADADSVYNTSFSSSRSTPDLDYAHLRARLHQEEQA